jgi:glyoxylase I family protein
MVLRRYRPGVEPLPILSFSHVCIGVGDVDRSLDFYRRVLGMDVVFDVELEGESLETVTGGAGSKGRMVGGLVGGVMLELLSFGPGRAPERPSDGTPLGYTNISVSVPDLDAAHRQVIELDAPPGPIVEIAGVRMFFVADPDGTAIEVIEYPNGGRTSLDLWR